MFIVVADVTRKLAIMNVRIIYDNQGRIQKLSVEDDGDVGAKPPTRGRDSAGDSRNLNTPTYLTVNYFVY